MVTPRDTSRGTSGEAVAGYASAIVTVAQAEGTLARVETELYAFARTVEASSEVRERLSDPAVPVEAKIAAIDELLGGHPQTSAAVMYVVQSGRARQLVQIADAVARPDCTTYMTAAEVCGWPPRSS